MRRGNAARAITLDGSFKQVSDRGQVGLSATLESFDR